MGKIIGVVSLKGGVGKTSTVVELGSAISGFGKKVLLVDGNLSSPNLGLRYGIVEPEKTLHHVLQRSAHARDAVYELNESIDLMPSSLFFRDEVNPLKLKEHLRMLKRKYDYILIDSSPSLDSETLAVMLASDNIIVVTTPDHVTLGTTVKAVKRARQRGAPIGGLVLNKVHNKGFELSLPEIEDVLDIPVLAVVGHNLDMLKSVSDFTSLVDTKPNSEESHEFKKLAATLIGEKYKPKRLKNLFHFTPKREEINREIYYERVFG